MPSAIKPSVSTPSSRGAMRCIEKEREMEREKRREVGCEGERSGNDMKLRSVPNSRESRHWAEIHTPPPSPSADFRPANPARSSPGAKQGPFGATFQGLTRTRTGLAQAVL